MQTNTNEDGQKSVLLALWGLFIWRLHHCFLKRTLCTKQLQDQRGETGVNK